MTKKHKTTPKVPLLDEQLCYALHSASLAMTKIYRTLLPKLGLTYSQYLVMMVLWEQDGLTVSEIGAKLFLDSATLTPLLKRLEAAGFVERNRSPKDERQVTISLTESGSDLRAKSIDLAPALLCATRYSLNEVEALRDQLIHLRTNLLRDVD